MHPSYWPKREPDLKGKRIASIGTGCTGGQLALSIFDDTPEKRKDTYEKLCRQGDFSVLAGYIPRYTI